MNETNFTNLTLICLLLLIFHVAYSVQGPQVPLQSTAQIRYTYYSFADMYARYGGSEIEIGFMELITDMLNNKLHMASAAYDTIAPNANSVTNNSLLFQNSAPTYEVNNGQCYKSGNAYGDFYWWIQLSIYSGSVKCPFYDVNNTCSLYTYTLNTNSYSVILDSNSYIHQLNITDFEEQDGNRYELGYISMNFYSFTPSVNNSVFVEPSICYSSQSDTFFCNYAGKKVETIYFLHNNTDYTIGPNVGDLLGYAAYLCWKSSFSSDKVLTQMNIQMLENWGQYSVCYSLTDCNGGNSKSVGRECPYGFFDLQGQCIDLSTYGQWFSLRNDARCPLLSSVGTNNCSWHFRKTLKTISFGCLINEGLFTACYEDSRIPFNSAANVILNAFRNCPEIYTSNTDVFEDEIQNNIPTNHYHYDNNMLDHPANRPISLLKKFASLI